MHIAWWRIGSGIGYTAFVEGSTTPVIKTLLSTGANPPRVTAADSGRVIVYFPLSNGQVQFCEVYDTNADGVPDSCCINGASCGDSGWQTVDPGPQRQDGSFPLKWSTPGGGLGGPGVSGGNIYIRAAFPIAMAISESGDTLYYCFHQNETNGPGPDADTREETDAYCTTGTRDPATGLWSWNTNPVLLSGGTRNDDKDQFAPEVVLTQEQGSYTAGRETAIITFYDRSDDTSNHNYKVKKTVSTDRLASAFPPRAMFNGNTSDPAYLPRHCFDSNTRFIGDYAGAEGHVVHAQSISVTVPTPGTIGAAMNANFNALGHWNR